MNIHQLSRHTKITQAINPQSSSTVLNGAVIDMAGFDAVMVIVNVGAITTTGTVAGKGQMAAAVGFGTPIDILGSASVGLIDTDDNKMLVWDFSGDWDNQFFRIVITPATAAALVGATYVQYRRNSGGAMPIALAGGAAQLILRPDPIAGTP